MAASVISVTLFPARASCAQQKLFIRRKLAGSRSSFTSRRRQQALAAIGPASEAAVPGAGLSPELKSAIDQFITENKVYIDGEFFGGCDIMIASYQSGELSETIERALNS